MEKVLDYRDNTDLFVSPGIETKRCGVRGTSYGAEVFVDKTVGKPNGWVSYSWFKTDFDIKRVNQDKSFPARYDIRPKATTTISSTYNQRWVFSSTFRITSGGKVAIPEGDFSFLGGTFNV